MTDPHLNAGQHISRSAAMADDGQAGQDTHVDVHTDTWHEQATIRICHKGRCVTKLASEWIKLSDLAAPQVQELARLRAESTAQLRTIRTIANDALTLDECKSCARAYLALAAASVEGK
jgi:hypothetical protein